MYSYPNPILRNKKDQQENKESTINAITIQMIEDLLLKFWLAFCLQEHHQHHKKISHIAQYNTIVEAKLEEFSIQFLKIEFHYFSSKENQNILIFQYFLKST